MKTKAIKMPRIAHKPTDKNRGIVEAMSSYGITQEVIAKRIDIGVTSLNKYYREELDRGDGMAQAKIGEALYEKAVISKDTACLIFLAKTRLGLKEVSRVEATGPDGKPTAMKVTYRKWTPEDTKPGGKNT